VKDQGKSSDALHEMFDRMGENWQSEIVARCRMGEFSGGMLTAKTMANYDFDGKGPDGRIKIGRKTGYIKKYLIEWLKLRANLA